MEDRNSIEYLQSLKHKYSNRYEDKPTKPRKVAEVSQLNKRSCFISEDILRKLYDEAHSRLMAKGKRPLPYVAEAEDGLNEALRICLMGWADLKYFKMALGKWEQAMQGHDETVPVQETLF